MPNGSSHGTKVLKFVNRYYELIGEKPKVTEIELASAQDPHQIIAWYQSYYSGDPLEVYVNGDQIHV